MIDLGLEPEQLERYGRHVVMEDVGPGGQAALLDASVLVVGAGGLGSPVLQYLVAAGVGRLGVVDDDVVERSNLQRQVLHGVDDLGRPKVDSAADAIAALNPGVEVERYETRLGAGEAAELVEDYDLVVDASDNFPTRFLLNDACVLANRPLVHGAVYRFEGQVTTIAPGGRPCYRCLFPEAPPEGTVPDCATAGVLGVLPGTIGCLQATEVVKWILGEHGGLEDGELLTGEVLYYDATGPRFDSVELQPRPDCPVCGEDATLGDVRDVTYEGACAVEAD